MEFMLLPNTHSQETISTPKTPYVCHRRYDGGPFLSYPMRAGKAEAGSALLDISNYHRAERVNPTQLPENEAFIQSWLYFGFIAEFLCANTKEPLLTPSEQVGSNDKIGEIYKMLLIPDGSNFIVELSEETLNKFVEIARSRLPADREDKIKHYDHLLECLALAHRILSALPSDFNHTVKFSILGLCELVAQAIRAVFLIMGVQRIFGRGWAVGFLTAPARSSMIENGWCPSDIVRAEAKFQSLQAMHVIRYLDKKLPLRDHTACTETLCNIYQINMGQYQVGHEHAGCTCEALTVDPEELGRILKKDEQVPLLRFTGDLQDLRVELVEFKPNMEYIAVSHVWADGLGNPYANSLHRCKLVRLRDLAYKVNQTGAIRIDPPLIWLDSLCCPAKDGEGKQKAIEKIRLVYRSAKHVLVLDAGLMAYASKDQEIHEQVTRIFTSGWVRRLWTLQEGALARNLYFQFADEAVSMHGLRKSFGQNSHSVRMGVFANDALQEFWRIDAFFKSDQHNMSTNGPDLAVLDQALQFRSVSVPSDEPLCIGTLMSLDLPAILTVKPKDDRMQKVWTLLAAKLGGIPALVIFLEEQRINADGWRWAPKSLLSYQKSIHQANVRIIRWSLEILGTPTPLGLKVRFPGFKITLNTYQDGKPRHPWPGLKRIPEAYMHVRDSETEEWYMLSDKRYAYFSSKWTTEAERRDFNKLEHFPLHDVAQTGKALVLMRGQIEHARPEEAIFVSPAIHTDTETEGTRGEENGLAVETERHIMIHRLEPGDAYIYKVIRRLAMELRVHEMTDAHLKLHAHLRAEDGDDSKASQNKMGEDEVFKDSIKALREKMKVVTAEVIQQDQRFVEAIMRYFGASFLEDMWVLIQDFFNHDFLATKLPDDQVWYVD